jgi:hypothetical protein
VESISILRQWGTRPMVWTIREGANGFCSLREPEALRFVAPQRGQAAHNTKGSVVLHASLKSAPEAQCWLAPRFSVGKASTPGQCRSPGGTVPSHRTRSVDSFAKKNGKTQNRGRLPQMSNSDCRPGRAGGFPGCNNPDVILSERSPKRLPGSPKSAFALWGGAWGW